ncbi:MAG: tRNA epoxyqueuosine(34) reductase QueG [Proteobacteria bacterium]|nr:tRNA epoxyqueuosine(34) reductase QueG [Pseudomonadota bacterium]
MNKQNPYETLNALATDSGLNFLGVTGLNVKRDFHWYETWLSEGRHAEMRYLENHLELRADPKKLLPGAKYALVFGLPYFSGDRWQRGVGYAHPRFAMYARLKDYHKILKRELGELMNKLKARGLVEKEELFRVTCDSAPLLERALTAGAGKGFIGKNTCYIHPKLGSFLLLGEILTTWSPPAFSDLPGEPPTPLLARTSGGGCGTCKRCQVHCPTGALDQDYRIDARKCLSWWTIENRGPIPEVYWKWIGQYIFGCDICQLVCPWNRGAEMSNKTSELTKLSVNIDPYFVATMDAEAYEQMFAGTPATRAKREGLVRNALIALFVRSDPRIFAAIDLLKQEPNDAIRVTIATINSKLIKIKV